MQPHSPTLPSAANGPRPPTATPASPTPPTPIPPTSAAPAGAGGPGGPGGGGGGGGPVFRIAFTGGPCGGKTTALAEVSERLRSRGVHAFVVPEAATLFFTGGANALDLCDAAHAHVMQRGVLDAQLALEDAFARMAVAVGGPAVVLCDRGALDGRAYMRGDGWRALLHAAGHDEVALRDGRYDMVVHMVTAAVGAQSFYNTFNNSARRESAAEAEAQDLRTRDAWVGHPHLRIVDNRTGFQRKIDRVFGLVADVVGVPGATGWRVRKFLVRAVAAGADGQCAEFEVQQTFLKRERRADVVESVRERSDGFGSTFVHSIRRDGAETKRSIRRREYLTLLAHSDTDRRMVRIKRRCFVHGHNYFVIDDFADIDPPVVLVRCHFEAGEGEVGFPEWLRVEREVTGEFEFTVYAMSRKVKRDRVQTGAHGKTIEVGTRKKNGYAADGLMFAKSL